MRITALLCVLFISIVFYSFSGNYRDTDLIGCTELNGTGCVCHNLEESPEVLVWVEGPDTLQQGQTALYRMYMAGGPAIAGGYNVAAASGVLTAVDSFSYWDYRAPNELTQAFPLPFATTQDTIFWEFAFTAPGNVNTDTIFSCGLSTNWDSIPDHLDLWAFGPRHPVVIIPEVPVEFASFTGLKNNNTVELNWTTATETNNSGFLVLRSAGTGSWEDLNFISGKGNSTEINNYSYTDVPPAGREYKYRLKQIDYNGSYSYSDIVNVDMSSLPEGFALMQNYPNPFNPSTTISFSVPEDSRVRLSILNLIGEELLVLADEMRSKGVHEIHFDAQSLPSGIYLYRLETSGFNTMKKMILLK